MSSEISFECNSPDVVFENFGDEVILLNLQTGRYYSLDPVGMFYWEHLSQGVSPRELAAHIGRAYSDQAGGSSIAGDLDGLLNEFRSEQLIRPSKTPRALADVTNATTKLPAEYVPPVVSKFDDVAEMLLLDPVHDVGELGWPRPAPLDQDQG